MARGPPTAISRCPLLTTERELAEGNVLWTDVSITYTGLLLGLRPNLVGR